MTGSGAPGSRRFLVLAACLVVTGCGNTTGPTAGPGDVPPSNATPTGTAEVQESRGALPSDVSVPEGEAPAAVQLAESGYTTFSAGGQNFASFAALLVNPNRASWRAHRVTLHVDFYLEDGTFAGTTDAIATVLPGQTVAIGGETFGAGSATRMDVVIPGDPSDFVADDGTSGTFEVLDVTTTRKDGANVTTGRLVSHAAARVDSIELVAVYRNRAGAIIGGASGGVQSIDPGAEVSFEVVDSVPYPEIGATDVYWQVPE